MKFAIISALVSVLATGCATYDRRDAAWDPPQGRSLFEQLPAWDGAAQRICCGGKRECLPGQSPRC
jgi:hypothetical protein